MLEHKGSQGVNSLLYSVQIRVAADVHRVQAAFVERVNALYDFVDEDFYLTVLLIVGLKRK